MFLSASRTAIRLFIVLIHLYLLSPLGATFHGTVIPNSQPLTFGLVAMSLILWLVFRGRGKWQWYGTNLDVVLPLWVIAIATSILANPETAARSNIGLWFAMLYLGTWYVVHDLAVNCARARKWLIDGLLCAGLVLMIFSLLQMLTTGKWIHPVSLIGNANALGTVMLVIVPLALGRMFCVRHRLVRLIWAAYSIAAVAIAMLTLSRGAWLGMIAALVVFLFLTLQDRDLVSMNRMKRHLAVLSLASRRLIFAGSASAVLVVVILLGLTLNSFSIHERRAELRGDMWKSALLQFAEKPLTGQGLFTFGFHYNRTLSVPPALPYAHAHSLPLNIAAELGILGIMALAFTSLRIVGSFRRAWANHESDDRTLLMCSASSIVGFAVHHLFDTTAMMPAVALLGLTLLAVLSSSEQRLAIKTRSRRLARHAGLAVLWISILLLGWQGSEVNRRYIQALRASDYDEASRKTTEAISNYRHALKILDEVVARDPDLPVYLQQKAYLLGLVAASGDSEALADAILAFYRFLELEPDNAISWANLSALFWQSGETTKAVKALEHAIDLAPRSGIFVYNLATYLGMFSRDKIELPHSGYNQEFTRFQFYRESLPLTFLPQVGWGNRD